MKRIVLRITSQGREWGFEVPMALVPAVGDQVTLWHGPPDVESEDVSAGTVTGRRWLLAAGDDPREPIECVELDVAMETAIPESHVPDSTLWPACYWSQHSSRVGRVK